MTHAADAAEVRPLQVEMNGINVIAESERKGRPRDLFWPWFAANVSVLGLSYGAFVLGFGISFWQAVIVGAVGIVLSSFGVFFLGEGLSVEWPLGDGALLYIAATLLIVSQGQIAALVREPLTA